MLQGERYDPLDDIREESHNEGFQDAIRYVKEILTQAEVFHPYKVPGMLETYGEYSDGWNDCLTFIDARLKGAENGTEND